MTDGSHRVARTPVDEAAVALLLRSPHLEIGQIMELMDIGDREFRDMADRNHDIAERLEERRIGALQPLKSAPKRCKSCNEWFLPLRFRPLLLRCLQAGRVLCPLSEVLIVHPASHPRTFLASRSRLNAPMVSRMPRNTSVGSASVISG